MAKLYDIGDLALTHHPLRSPVIGFSGRKGSGKSTAANIVVAMLKAGDEYGMVRMSFAATLKEMVRKLLTDAGVDEETVVRMVYGDLKEEPLHMFCGKTTRHLMQTLGDEWGRTCVCRDIWVRVAMGSVDRDVGVWPVAFVFDDVRYQEEVDAIVGRGGVVLRLPGGDGSDTHDSETRELQNILLVNEYRTDMGERAAAELLHKVLINWAGWR